MNRSFPVFLIFCCLVPSVAQESLEPVSVPEEAMQKLRVHTVKPVLPDEPGMRIEGTVVLNAIINKAGEVETQQLVSGNPALAPAALEAVKSWRYRPYRLNGIARAAETTIHVELSNKSDSASETSTEAVASRILLTPDDIPAQPVYRVAPTYPPLARQARIQGVVILKIAISKMGDVRDTELVRGHPLLAPAAVDAIKKWRYVPYEIDGKTVEVETEVQVIFRLAG